MKTLNQIVLEDMGDGNAGGRITGVGENLTLIESLMMTTMIFQIQPPYVGLTKMSFTNPPPRSTTRLMQTEKIIE